MEHNVSDREQLEEIRKWWDANGKAIVVGLALGLCGLVGYRYWQDVQTRRAESASLNYQQFLRMAAAGPSDELNKTGQSIIDAYGGSAYSRLTALLLARMAVESNKLDDAKRQLEWVIAQDGKSALASVARARLARVLLAQGAADAAWHELEQIPAGASGPLFAEVRGDVLAALGKPDEASAMYTQALTSLAEVGADATAIELKRDALGVGTAAAEAN